MTKRQVVVIGGGESFDTREEYLAFLRGVPYDPTEVRPEGWKKNLQAALGDGFEVIAPQMPCAWNAKYDEWQIWFDKVVPFLRDDVTLVGHSLGANFLVKYLAENAIPVRVRGLHIVAGSFGCPGGFDLPDSLEDVPKRVGRVLIYHSRDDRIVPISDAESYHSALPGSEIRIFEDRGHFLDWEFSELEQELRGTEGASV